MLSDKIAFATRLPPSSVGPQINRAVLRLLRYAPAYRLYLNLCFEWDKYGARNGRLILPSRPEVRRAEGGHWWWTPGGRFGHGAATGGYEGLSTPRMTSEPSRSGGANRTPPGLVTRSIREDDLAALAFPPSAWADKNNRHKLRERALKPACELKALGGLCDQIASAACGASCRGTSTN